MDNNALRFQSEIYNLKSEMFKVTGARPVLLHPSGSSVTHGHLTSFNNDGHVSDTFGIL